MKSCSLSFLLSQLVSIPAAASNLSDYFFRRYKYTDSAALSQRWDSRTCNNEMLQYPEQKHTVKEQIREPKDKQENTWRVK